jgi:hypothetical protein
LASILEQNILYTKPEELHETASTG